MFIECDGITVSLVLLTFNRKKAVMKSLAHNIKNAGYPITDIIHVDNGSTEPGLADWVSNHAAPSVQILHAKNEGVAKGYNRGLLMATTSHIVITGCDRMMPKNWLSKMVDAFRRIPNTGVISCYSHPTKSSLDGTLELRYKSGQELINGVYIRQSQPCEARMHSRYFLHKAGLFREDFGLYGMEDCEWVDRAERTATREGLINYCLSDLDLALHLPDDDFVIGIDGRSYKEFKEHHNTQEYKQRLVKKLHDLGNPHYNPYARIEPKIDLE